MTRDEKLTEAKLMAVENILRDWSKNGHIMHEYDVAQEILESIRYVEIKQELADHESYLEEVSRNKPE